MPLDEALRRLDELNWGNVALAVSLEVGHLVSAEQAREIAQREIRDLYRACTCPPPGSSYESYEGPQRECPVHGEDVS